MLLGGDEIGRTQGGNNNAYCQDNAISWFDWDHEDGALLAFAQRLIAFRRAHPVFRRRHFFHGESLGADAPDIAWFRPDGSPDEGRRLVGRLREGDRGVPERRHDPEPRTRAANALIDDSFLVLFNAHHELLSFTTPAKEWGARWLRMLDTADAFNEGEGVDAAAATRVDARSLALFRRTG